MSGTTLAKAKTAAKTDLATTGIVKELLTFTVVDCPLVRRGDFVMVEDSRKALDGLWLVSAVQHDQVIGTMSITLEVPT